MTEVVERNDELNREGTKAFQDVLITQVDYIYGCPKLKSTTKWNNISLFAGYTKIYTFPAKSNRNEEVEWIDFLDDVANQIPNKFYLAD